MYIWNSQCNSFDPYEEQNENYAGTLYTEAEVDALFAMCGENQGLVDVGGVPTVINLLSQEELTAQANAQRIAELKALLAGTDYQAIKYGEGEMTLEEYAPIKALRASWRAEINSYGQ